MKTIFDQAIREELIERISSITQDSMGLWGKMNVFQMVAHNTYWNNWILHPQGHRYKQEPLGRLFGKMALRKMIRDDSPFDRNIPTSAQFKVRATQGDLEAEKLKWISLVRDYETYDNPAFIHDFFGKMTRQQIGILVHKHTDHHLRQFGL